MSEILQYFLLLKTKFTRVILSANFINGLSYKKMYVLQSFYSFLGPGNYPPLILLQL